MANIVDGSSLAGTSTSELSHSMSTNRNCTVEITNHTGEALTDPNQYCHSGYCHNALQPIIEPRTRDVCAFSKTAQAATGAVGVFSYRLGNSSQRFAVMFSVPYDYSFYENWFALAFIDAGTDTDEVLYDSMYNNNDWKERIDRQRINAKSGKTLHIERDGWKISATMSEAKKAIIQVEVTSSNQSHSHHHHQGGPYVPSPFVQYGFQSQE